MNEPQGNIVAKESLLSEIHLVLPEGIHSRLKGKARNMRCSLEEAALRILDRALEDRKSEPQDDLEEIVRQIKSIPPNPESIRSARGDLEEALSALPEEPDFDFAQWERQWDEMEEEMRRTDALDDMAEGCR
jgi:hypothetical protein